MSTHAVPPTTKYDEAINAFITQLNASIPPVPSETTEALPAYCVRYKARTVCRVCGVKRMHAPLLGRLAQLLSNAKIHTQPTVTDPALRADDWIHFARVRFGKSPLLAHYERTIEALLVDGIGRADGLRDLRLLQEQYRLANGRVIDLLCEEVRRDGRGKLVAIEVKRAHDERVVEQVVSYVRELQRDPVAEGREVRAMIVTGLDDPVGRKMLDDLSDVEIGWYRYHVSVEPVNSSDRIGM